jgi:ubiquinone/menaquinone biosynthesis C-methylase UbiE
LAGWLPLPKNDYMGIKQAYNNWAAQYDANRNRTRDLEAKALRMTLSGIPFRNGLEIGCGTGKNTEWLAEKGGRLTAVDFSEEMLARAREKIGPGRVQFIQADIKAPWHFGDELFDLVSFSLVLEHIEQLDPVFREAAAVLQPGGHMYIGELHPFKQYTGTRARFDTEEGRQVPDCFIHHISDFVRGTKKHGLAAVDINEYFDDEDRTGIPRILALLLRKV